MDPLYADYQKICGKFANELLSIEELIHEIDVLKLSVKNELLWSRINFALRELKQALPQDPHSKQAARHILYGLGRQWDNPSLHGLA